MGKTALQRVGVKLGGIEGARGQFGAVIEREGPWEVRVETPGVVKGWVTWVRAQQGRRFGVTRGAWKREDPTGLVVLRAKRLLRYSSWTGADG